MSGQSCQSHWSKEAITQLCRDVCVRDCVWESEKEGQLLTTTFSIHLDSTRPPLPITLAWDKLYKQEVRRPGTSRLPSNGPLVPRGSTEKLWAFATKSVFPATFAAFTMSPDPLFWSSVQSIHFPATWPTFKQSPAQWSHYPLANLATKQLYWGI